MATRRGLYGQSEGGDARCSKEWFEDRCHENQLCESNWLTPMIEAAKEGDLKELERLRESMKKDYIRGGVTRELAQERADANLRIAMNHLRL